MKLKQKRLILTTIAVGLLMVTSAACTPKSSPPINSNLESKAKASPAAGETSEGAQANLQTFDETANSVPITAQYSDAMEATSSSSDEGIGVFFNFKPQGNALDGAKVQVFLPAGDSSTEDLMPFVTGPNGLIETNGWTVTGPSSSGAFNSYPWVKQVFDFSTDQQQAGHILIGETANQAVQVILLYPTAMVFTYWPAAKTILDSLTFEPSLLPIKASVEGST